MRSSLDIAQETKLLGLWSMLNVSTMMYVQGGVSTSLYFSCDGTGLHTGLNTSAF